MANIMASSGSAIDIQEAVSIASIGDNVIIPEGTFNFVEPGISLSPVLIPAGVNIFGAPTKRTKGLPIPSHGMNPNDQVVNWKTVLILPSYENAPTSSGSIGEKWFRVLGTEDPDAPTRISDIQLIGYREFDPTSTQQTVGIEMIGVIGFRVDHCSLRNLGGIGIRAEGYRNGLGLCSGVIDHNRIENPAGGIIQPYGSQTLTYGVGLGRGWWLTETDWIPDISEILGKYTEFSIYMENNYFSKWRHCVAGNHGSHYVFRYNTIDMDYGFGSLDAHNPNAATEIGARATEVYNNVFINKEVTSFVASAILIRGGGGVIFDNYEDGSYSNHIYGGRFVYLQKWTQYPAYTWPYQVYIWNNDISMISPVWTDPGSDFVEGIDYFLHKPQTFQYNPYPYPHPLTKSITSLIKPLVIISVIGLAYWMYLKKSIK